MWLNKDINIRIFSGTVDKQHNLAVISLIVYDFPYAIWQSWLQYKGFAYLSLDTLLL